MFTASVLCSLVSIKIMLTTQLSVFSDCFPSGIDNNTKPTK